MSSLFATWSLLAPSKSPPPPFMVTEVRETSPSWSWSSFPSISPEKRLTVERNKRFIL